MVLDWETVKIIDEAFGFVDAASALSDNEGVLAVVRAVADAVRRLDGVSSADVVTALAFILAHEITHFYTCIVCDQERAGTVN